MNLLSMAFPIAIALVAGLTIPQAQAREADALYWVFLNRGDNKTPLPKEEAARLQQEHVGNLGKLGEQGKALTAGPLGDDGSIRGIVVLTVKTPQEVTDCFTVDPFVQKNYLAVEAYRWLADRKGFHKPDVPFKIAQYTLGIVKKGPNWQPIKGKIRANMLSKLLVSLKRLSDAHNLAVAGPLLDANDRIGILLFRTPDQAKIRQELDRDPVIRAGHVLVELHEQWLGKGVFGN